MTVLDIKYNYAQDPNNAGYYNMNFDSASETMPFFIGGSVGTYFSTGPLDGPNNVFPTPQIAAAYYHANGVTQGYVDAYNSNFGMSVTLGALHYYMVDAYDSRFAALESSMPAASSYTNPTVALNSAAKISTTRDAQVAYSVDISCSMSLTGGQSGTAILEYADDSAFTTNVKTVAKGTTSNSGTLTIGLALVQIGTANLSGKIPANKYRRVRTVNNTGTPTFTMQNSQEVLL